MFGRTAGESIPTEDVRATQQQIYEQRKKATAEVQEKRAEMLKPIVARYEELYKMAISAGEYALAFEIAKKLEMFTQPRIIPFVTATSFADLAT